MKDKELDERIARDDYQEQRNLLRKVMWTMYNDHSDWLVWDGEKWVKNVSDKTLPN